jgi:hypothetical protein
LEGFIIDFGQNDNLSGAMYELNVAVPHFYIMYYSYGGNGG